MFSKSPPPHVGGYGGVLQTPQHYCTFGSTCLAACRNYAYVLNRFPAISGGMPSPSPEGERPSPSVSTLGGGAVRPSSPAGTKEP